MSIELRIPKEFRFWENVRHPPWRLARSAAHAALGFDPVLPDATIRTWASTYYDADPIAEAFADEVYLQHGQTEGRRLLDLALQRGVDAVHNAPQSLRRLFEETETRPPWFDRDRIALGARVFRRWGVDVFRFAGAITLEGYRENSVAKPLALTGAYAGSTARKRFLETASFWIDVSQPDALEPGGAGRSTALRVRMMHVFVRKRLLEHPSWDLESWGVPISQGDALLTLMGGSIVPSLGLRLLGYRTSREEIEATLCFWRYVGYLMGVNPRWYPTNVDDAIKLMFASMVKASKASGEDGVLLARSFVDAFATRGATDRGDSLRDRLDHGLQRAHVAWFVPPGSQRALGLRGGGVWRWAPIVAAPYVFARETLRRRSLRYDAHFDRATRESTLRWLQSRRVQQRAEYRAAESFTR